MSTHKHLDVKNLQVITLLQEKLEPVGQNLSCHLESLYHAKFLNYWDYTQLDILLKLQQPKTAFPDEMIFITYHQITELYFKLILWEAHQVLEQQTLDPVFFYERIIRINRYLKHIVDSFDIMLDGLDRHQFLLFRKALVPASGFQSLQFRMIELCATDPSQLARPLNETSEAHPPLTLEELYQTIYWKQGARDVASDGKDMCLIDFERAYDDTLLNYAKRLKGRHFYAQLQAMNPADQHYQAIVQELRKFDYSMNVKWKLIHFKTAVKHLQQPNHVERATGGSNWMQYLPPRFQKVIFYPSLWTAVEKQEWGKNFLEEMICEK